MADPLILIARGQQSRRLLPTEYESEAEFQALIAEYPELLAGDQIYREVHRRFLLVRKEMSISDGEGAASRWSLDHLFVDQDGMATLVELKRQSDTRLRREVIGQVLEYAANAATTWTADRLGRAFEGTWCCKEPAETLKTFLQGRDPQQFWELVASRIGKGEMRLLFVSDRVPQELIRIVEFLNEQMSTTEVLAVEIQRYVAGEYATHVPRVFGRTAQARDAKTAGRAVRHWDDASFREDCDSQPLKSEQKDAVLAVYELARTLGFATEFGNGKTPSIKLSLKEQASSALLTLKSNGELWVNPGYFLKPEHAYLATALRQFAAALHVPPERSQDFTYLRLSEWENQADSVHSALRTLAKVRPPEKAAA